MKIALGGSKSAPTPKPIIPTNYGPNTSSDYMVKGVVVDTNLHNNGLYNLPGKTKHFENHSTASSTTTDVKTTYRDESKVIKTENLAPTISYEVVEQIDGSRGFTNSDFNIKDLLDNGWEIQEVGDVLTQNGENRTKFLKIDTKKGVLIFGVYIFD